MAVAIKSNASSFLIAHNHPSSSLLPSEHDRNLTRRIRKAADFFDLVLLDHLILRKEEGFYSFADDGII
jgi:DNA repair protein RadC